MHMRIIIIGGGDTVYFLARQMKAKHHDVTIINRDKAVAEDLFQRTEATVIHGDGSDQAILAEAGARRADIVLALTPHDHDNLIASQIAQKIFGVPRTIALVNDPENEDIFQKLGVTAAFSATRIIAKMIEQRANFDDIKRMIPVGETGVNVSDIELDRESPVVGKRIMDLELSPDTLIACIIRNDEVIVPRGSNQLHIGDHVLVISQPRTEDRDLKYLAGERD